MNKLSKVLSFRQRNSLVSAACHVTVHIFRTTTQFSLARTLSLAPSLSVVLSLSTSYPNDKTVDACGGCVDSRAHAQQFVSNSMCTEPTKRHPNDGLKAVFARAKVNGPYAEREYVTIIISVQSSANLLLRFGSKQPEICIRN